ncbi:MAG: tetratricopeptide repeat protein [Candidatus Hodarchaeales archaeon]
MVRSSQDKLQKARKKIIILKRNLEENFTHSVHDSKLEDIEIKLEGLTDVVNHINKIFGEKTWIGEIEKRIEKEIGLDSLKEKIEKFAESKVLETETKTLEAKDIALEAENKTIVVKEKAFEVEAVKSVLNSLREAGVSARKEKSYDKAIEILKDIDTKLLPSIAIHLPDKDKRDLKSSLMKELEKTHYKRGKIDDAIKVIDEGCTETNCDSKVYIKSQIDKSHLLVQKGEFNQAVDLLKNAIKYLNSLPDNERELGYSAEIKRSLGIAYRGQGAYQKSIRWFKESQGEHRKAKDNWGYHNALWGIGILRHLTGEWEEAIEIWRKLIAFFEKQPDHIKGEKPTPFLLIKAFIEYSRTLQFCGKFKEAEEKLDKALTIVQDSDYEYTGWYQGYLHLLFSDLYYQQNEITNAAQSIAEARRINDRLEMQQKDTISELKILKHEINVLLALDKAEEAKKKLLKQFNNCKSNWELSAYYRQLGMIEKHEMNFGLAKEAFRSSLEKTKEIGASSISDELLFIELLIEMSRTGNQKAYREAESLLAELETDIKKKKLSAFILEVKLQKAHLACSHSNYEIAYQLYSEIIKDADKYRLLRQRKKALDGIYLIEQEASAKQLLETRELSVYRYLEDAQRILEENS